MPNLTFVPLVNVVDSNHWNFQTQWTVIQQNTYVLYLQLQDQDQKIGYTQDFSEQPKDPLFLRYMPNSGSGLVLTINDLNSQYVVTSQPFASDPSIWSFNLSASQTATMSGGDVSAQFTDSLSGIVTNIYVPNVLKVIPSNRSSC